MRKLLIVLLLAACIIAGECGWFKKTKNKIKNKVKKLKEVKDKIEDIKNKISLGDIPTTGRPDNWSDCLEQDVDAYLDRVLEQAKEQIPDPIRLPPRSAFVELSEGRVWGMPTLHRYGPVKVTCDDSNDTVVISGKLATDELKARYTWEKGIAGKKREGFVLVKTSDFEADVELVIQKGEEHPRLEKFKIQRFKSVKVEMTGLGLLTWALGEITTMMSGILQWAIARAVQGPLREALERELMEVSLT